MTLTKIGSHNLSRVILNARYPVFSIPTSCQNEHYFVVFMRYFVIYTDIWSFSYPTY